MPTYQITTPDGAKYNVTAPDGTSQEDVLAYAQAQHAEESGPSAYARMMAAGNSFASGLRDPIEGGAQLLRHLTPAPVERALDWANEKLGMGPVPSDENERAREARIQADRGGETGTDWARIAGNIASPVNYVPMAVLGRTAAAGRLGAAALTGGALGAESGALQPVTGEGGYWGEKALQTGIGGVAGAATGAGAELAIRAAEPVLRPLFDYASGISDGKLTPGQAEVLRRVAQDAKGGGPSAQDMIDLVKESAARGTPATLADVGGENVKGLLGRIARTPGEAKQFITKTLTARDEAAGGRLETVLDRDMAPGSMKQTFDAMVQARSAGAREPWAKAMEGGSVAPLERQFEVHFDAAGKAEKEATQALQQARNEQTVMAAQTSPAVTPDNVYAQQAAKRAAQFAADKAQQAEKALAAAQETKAEALARLRQAQADGTANAKGAVWSPRLQQFLDDPIIKSGISHGMKLERLEALSEGRTMNPSEYAIVGTDTAGEPIVGAVPNMRLLQTAKEGIDRILDEPAMRNELTGKLTKEGIAVDKVRRAFLGELDTLNPDYAAARQQWSGATQSMQSLKAGRDHFKLSPEEGAEAFARMTPNDQEFYKLGVADKIKEMIGKTGFAGDEARAVAKNQRMKDQLRPLFATQEDFDRFIASVDDERKLFATKYETLGNSRTAARMAEDQSPESAAFEAAGKAAFSAAHGNYLAALNNTFKAISFARATTDPARNAEMARLMLGAGPDSPAMRLLGNALARNQRPRPAALNALQLYGRQIAPALAVPAQALAQPNQQ